MSVLDLQKVCFFQGRNGYGEALPSHAAFVPFFPWTFHLPVVSAQEFAEVLAWCSAALGERDEGRWLEDFDHWHLGDEVAAEGFKAAWITPRARKWGSPQVDEQ